VPRVRPALLLTALLLAAPLPRAAAEEPTRLHAGPMLGYVAKRSAAVWLQTRRAADVQLRVHPADDPAAARLTGAVRTRAAEDFAHTFVLADLEPGVRYAYEVYVDGRRVAPPYPLDFTTRPLWEHRAPPPEVTLLVGSCAYVNEAGYGRPGEPYGGEHEIFRSMAEVPADAMLWLGDNVYLREVDWDTPEGIAARYRHDRALPALQPLLAATAHYATWDDHDYGPNDSDRTYPLKAAALEAFARYWPAVRYGLPAVPGVFQTFSIGDAQVFLLDGRYHRTPNRAPAGPHKTCFGPAQLQWLKEALVASRARFKLVASGNQFLNDVTPYESLAHHFPAELEELVGWVAEQRIEGVVLLSGDRHHTELLRRELPGGYPLYELTSSPLTSRAHGFGEGHPEFANPLRVEGTLVSERSFGVVRLTGPADDRRLVLEARAVDGGTLWRREVARSALGFGDDRSE